MTPAEAANLAATALTAYQHVRTVGAMTAKERGATMDLWAVVLGDLEYEPTRAALLRHIGTSEFFPTVAELRRILAEAQHGRQRPGLDAWADVKAAIGSVGRYRQPTFADPLVARMVASIGWVAICDSEDEMVTRAHFAKGYDALAVGAVEDRTVATLPGVARPALTDEARRLALLSETEATTPADRRMLRESNEARPVGALLSTRGAP